MIDDNTYFEYLKSRTLFGLFYRRFWLYPMLSRYIKCPVLDVGCGLGDMLKFCRNAIGVDINHKTIEWCKAKGLDVRLIQNDILPFNAGTFSSIVLDNVLEHIAAPKPLLSEIHRVLKSEGRMVVGVPGMRGYQTDMDHKVFYDENSLIKTFEESGFICKKLFHMPVRSIWLNQHLRQYCIYGVFGKR